MVVSAVAKTLLLKKDPINQHRQVTVGKKGKALERKRRRNINKGSRDSSTLYYTVERSFNIEY